MTSNTNDFLIEGAISMIVGFIMVTGPVLGIMYIPDHPEYILVSDAAKSSCWGLLTFSAGTLFSAARRVL